MARRLGISASALSQIERDRALPSLSTMVSLAKELQLSLDDLLGADWARHRVRFSGTYVSRSQTRVDTELGPGVRCSALSSESERGIRLFLATFEPAARADIDQLPLPETQPGLVAVVLKGSIHFVTSADEAVLEAGDALELEQRTLRAVRNEGGEPASVLFGSVEPEREGWPPPTASATVTRGSSPASPRLD